MKYFDNSKSTADEICHWRLSPLLVKLLTMTSLEATFKIWNPCSVSWRAIHNPHTVEWGFKRAKAKTMHADSKKHSLTLAFGFFKMNPLYQPAETKYKFNFQHVTMNITSLHIYRKFIKIWNLGTFNYIRTEKEMNINFFSILMWKGDRYYWIAVSHHQLNNFPPPIKMSAPLCHQTILLFWQPALLSNHKLKHQDISREKTLLHKATGNSVNLSMTCPSRCEKKNKIQERKQRLAYAHVVTPLHSPIWAQAKMTTCSMLLQNPTTDRNNLIHLDQRLSWCFFSLLHSL